MLCFVSFSVSQNAVLKREPIVKYSLKLCSLLFVQGDPDHDMSHMTESERFSAHLTSLDRLLRQLLSSVRIVCV